MKKKALFLTLPLVLLLPSCGENNSSPQPVIPTPTEKVLLDFGTYIDTEESSPVDYFSQVQVIKRSFLNRLVSEKYQSNFVLLLHGSGDTCPCYTNWHHRILSPYVKQHKTLVYLITLAEFETDPDYLGLKMVDGSETLAIFQNGKVAYQYTSPDSDTDPWMNDYATFAAWMDQRTYDAQIYTVSEEQLDSYYQGNEPFTVYFGRMKCGDCSYLTRTGLRTYLEGKTTTALREQFLFYDFDAIRDAGDMDAYQQKKNKYGLAEEYEGQPINPSGYGTGAFPTIFHVTPDGSSFYGDVIDAAGVFYNEGIGEGHISGSYYTAERFEEAKDTYLSYVKDIDPNILEGLKVDSTLERHEALKAYEEPLFKALLDHSL